MEIKVHLNSLTFWFQEIHIYKPHGLLTCIMRIPCVYCGYRVFPKWLHTSSLQQRLQHIKCFSMLMLNATQRIERCTHTHTHTDICTERWVCVCCAHTPFVPVKLVASVIRRDIKFKSYQFDITWGNTLPKFSRCTRIARLGQHMSPCISFFYR